MKRLLPFLGYSAAALTIAVAVLTPFLLMGVFSRGFAAAGLRIDPVYAGGEPARTLDRGAYRVIVYRPVTPRAPLSASVPFVQLRFTPAAALPPRVSESVALDGGTPDFQVDFAMPADPKQDLRVDVTALKPGLPSRRDVGRGTFSSMIARVGDSVVVRVPLREK